MEGITNSSNALRQCRRERGLKQKEVAWLIGQKTLSHVSRYEQNRTLPNLLTALKFEIIYRRPVAFLYPDLYQHLKREIRNKEEAHHGSENNF